MIRVYTDAAVAGNPGLAAVGVCIVTQGQQEQLTAEIDVLCDNHFAELWAIRFSLQYLKKEHKINDMIFLYSDSKLAVDAIRKKYVKRNEYRIILQDILELIEECSFFECEWVPDGNNKGSDHLARQALQQLKRKGLSS
ncbi:ribonuclease HI [Granulicatella balaenopterae]|uniref:Ribonuclease HI n=1 Tax=Granulicatella balaenopterae TaxID=137733 RepID=A0A1H9IEX3_9LACT|nr:ribonuclease HI family protein [Granulicatella balaenopterae]SEQ73104.1 ribonuclease HI [Granulicatella balaenopterae]